MHVRVASCMPCAALYQGQDRTGQAELSDMFLWAICRQPVITHARTSIVCHSRGMKGGEGRGRTEQAATALHAIVSGATKGSNRGQGQIR